MVSPACCGKTSAPACPLPCTPRGVRVAWCDVSTALLPPHAIDDLIAPYLGGDDPIFGFRFGGDLRPFFDAAKLAELAPDPAADLNIIYGCGAALASSWSGVLVYVDVPKNEIQFRQRVPGR